MLTAVAVSGYRSLRDVVVPLHGLDVVTGANGSGKSSLYRSLRLLASCGRGDAIGTLAREGGLQSALGARGALHRRTLRRAPAPAWVLRPLMAAELSDGTLRYLCLVAALLTVDPPPLMVLNEPETSLHPDLLPPTGTGLRVHSLRESEPVTLMPAAAL